MGAIGCWAATHRLLPILRYASTITFSKYPTNNTPLDERFEYIEGLWKRWQERDSFKKV